MSGNGISADAASAETFAKVFVDHLSDRLYFHVPRTDDPSGLPPHDFAFRVFAAVIAQLATSHAVDALEVDGDFVLCFRDERRPQRNVILPMYLYSESDLGDKPEAFRARCSDRLSELVTTQTHVPPATRERLTSALVCLDTYAAKLRDQLKSSCESAYISSAPPLATLLTVGEPLLVTPKIVFDSGLSSVCPERQTGNTLTAAVLRGCEPIDAKRENHLLRTPNRQDRTIRTVAGLRTVLAKMQEGDPTPAARFLREIPGLLSYSDSVKSDDRRFWFRAQLIQRNRELHDSLQEVVGNPNVDPQDWMSDHLPDDASESHPGLEQRLREAFRQRDPKSLSVEDAETLLNRGQARDKKKPGDTKKPGKGCEVVALKWTVSGAQDLSRVEVFYGDKGSDRDFKAGTTLNLKGLVLPAQNPVISIRVEFELQNALGNEAPTIQLWAAGKKVSALTHEVVGAEAVDASFQVAESLEDANVFVATFDLTSKVRKPKLKSDQAIAILASVDAIAYPPDHRKVSLEQSAFVVPDEAVFFKMLPVSNTPQGFVCGKELSGELDLRQGKVGAAPVWLVIHEEPLGDREAFFTPTHFLLHEMARKREVRTSAGVELFLSGWSVIRVGHEFRFKARDGEQTVPAALRVRELDLERLLLERGAAKSLDEQIQGTSLRARFQYTSNDKRHVKTDPIPDSLAAVMTGRFAADWKAFFAARCVLFNGILEQTGGTGSWPTVHAVSLLTPTLEAAAEEYARSFVALLEKLSNDETSKTTDHCLCNALDRVILSDQDFGTAVHFAPTHPLSISYLLGFQRFVATLSATPPRVSEEDLQGVRDYTPQLVVPYMAQRDPIYTSSELLAAGTTEHSALWRAYRPHKNAYQSASHRVLGDVIRERVDRLLRLFPRLKHVPSAANGDDSSGHADDPELRPTIHLAFFDVMEDRSAVWGISRLLRPAKRSEDPDLYRGPRFFLHFFRSDPTALSIPELQSVSRLASLSGEERRNFERPESERVLQTDEDIDEFARNVGYSIEPWVSDHSKQLPSVHLSFVFGLLNDDPPDSHPTDLPDSFFGNGLLPGVARLRHQAVQYSYFMALGNFRENVPGVGESGPHEWIGAMANGLSRLSFSTAHNRAPREAGRIAASLSTEGLVGRAAAIGDLSLLTCHLNPEVGMELSFGLPGQQGSKRTILLEQTDRRGVAGGTITTTRHIQLVRDVLRSTFEENFGAAQESFDPTDTFLDHLNLISGKWTFALLSPRGKSDVRGRLATVVALRHLIQRECFLANSDYLPLVVPLEDWLRVTGNIGLPLKEGLVFQYEKYKEYLEGDRDEDSSVFSDDLLVVYLPKARAWDGKTELTLFARVIEVKFGTSYSQAKATAQVLNTVELLRTFFSTFRDEGGRPFLDAPLKARKFNEVLTKSIERHAAFGLFGTKPDEMRRVLESWRPYDVLAALNRLKVRIDYCNAHPASGLEVGAGDVFWIHDRDQPTPVQETEDLPDGIRLTRIENSRAIKLLMTKDLGEATGPFPFGNPKYKAVKWSQQVTPQPPGIPTDVGPDISKTPLPPPMLTGLSLAPPRSRLMIGESVSLVVRGRDQFGATLPVHAIWTTSSGVISDTGVFTSTTVGRAEVLARCGGLEASAIVETLPSAQAPIDPTQPSAQAAGALEGATALPPIVAATVAPVAKPAEPAPQIPGASATFAWASEAVRATLLRQDRPRAVRGDDPWLGDAVQRLVRALKSYGLEARVSDQRLTPNAGLVRFHGSDRLQVKDIENRRTQLLTTHELRVIRVSAEPGQVVVSMERPERDLVSLTEVLRDRSVDNSDVRRNQSLVIGVRESDGSTLYLSPGRHAPHTLIAGSTGSGKSVLLQNLLLDIAITNSPALARITLIDPKQGVDYFAFERLPHLDGGLIVEQSVAVARLEAVVTEMDDRYRRFREARVSNLGEFNRKAAQTEQLPVLWVFHDEFAEWMLVDEYKNAVSNIVQRLGVKARAAGIFLVFAAQRPENRVMPVQLRDNLGNRLVLKVESEATSRIALGEEGAERLLGKGHLVARLQGEDGLVFAQVPFLDATSLEELVGCIAESGGSH